MRKKSQDRIDFHIEGSCKWDIEHGLEVTISDDRILYVGEFEDYGPNSNRLQYIIDKYGFYNPEIDMNVNYADKVEVDEYVGTIVINNSINDDDDYEKNKDYDDHDVNMNHEKNDGGF